MNDDLVSVYIPTRNRAELLERAVDSVLAQSHGAIEILVCDDASSDDTPALMERYTAAHKNVVHLRNETRLGACRSRNRAIDAAKGRFITGLDDDDEFLPDRIATFLDHFDPRWSCLSALSVSFLPSGAPHHVSQPTREVALDDMLYFNRLGNQVFCRTERLRELGGFDSRYPAWQDYELWTRLVARCGPALRIGKHTQRVHQDHGYARISHGQSALEASAMYASQFEHVMTRHHRAAQRFFLEVNYPQLGEPGLFALLSQATSPIFRELLGVYLFRRYPQATHHLAGMRAQARRLAK
jgi:glycosyltransferase involved in cell wall biosynthesis